MLLLDMSNLHRLPTPHIDYLEARLRRIALQAKLERLRNETAACIAEFQLACEQEQEAQEARGPIGSAHC
jgi:hypothetical protein